MANVTRSSRKLKDEDNNSSRQKHIGGKGSITSSPTAIDNSGLRRSTRETSLKKNSPSSIRKSVRLEKLTQPTPIKRKSERVEKRRMPSPLKRSDRSEKHRSSTSSGSNKSHKDLNSLDRKSKNDKREKNGKQLVVDAGERSRNKKKDKRALSLTLKRKRLDARSYQASFKPKETKAQESGHGEKLKVNDELSHQNSDSDSKEIEGDEDKCSEHKEEQMREKHVKEGCERSVEGSSSGSRKFTEGTLRNHGVKRKYCLEKAYESSNGDSLPSSKCSGNSLHSHPDGVTPKESIKDTDRVEVNCSTEEDSQKQEIMKATSKERSESSGPESPDFQKSYTAGAFKKYRKMADLDSNASVAAINEEICISTANAISTSPCGNRRSASLDRCTGYSRRQRNFLQDGTNYHAMVDDSVPLEEDEGEIEAKVSMRPAEECCSNMQLEESPSKVITESDHNACVICKLGGKLLRSCDGKGCKRSAHFYCLDTLLEDAPPSDWHCPWCVKKKIESGVHSVSKGVESIWDVREMELSNCEGKQKQKQYLVKYQGLAHIHNFWIPEDQLLLEAPSLLAKFMENQEAVRWKSEWTNPHRLIKKRLLMSLKQHDCNDDNLDCQYEWFVKWTGLGFEHATWELENASFLRSPEASILKKEYEDRLEKAKRASDPSRADKGRKSSFSKLLELPGRGVYSLNNDHLSLVNKLRECWHKCQNTVVIEDQERILRVILFILSLQSDVCRPFLVISTSSAISAWEAEFARLAPSMNVVVYSANKNVRERIQKLEFYEEGGCIMFHVLLASPDAVIEDLEALECIGWEIIIIDEGQNSSMSTHLEQIKMLTADVRLLLVTGPIKASESEYLNLLSFIDSGCDGKSDNNLKINSGKSDDNLRMNSGKGDDNLRMNSSDTINRLKERFLRFVASERKSDSSKFVEYWVPVRLSNVQLEHYCATLLTNSISLRSCSKNDPVGALRDILISARKCCDHPYLVDQSLQSLLTKGLPEVEYLDIGINASGKLHVLDKILSEMRKQGLRVLIVFQSIGGSGRNSIGDILDDFLRQRFGKDSYERVDSGLITSKKQLALTMFNNKERGRFVFLIENRACLPSIKLSSVDIVILFDSDWNPLNDLKALQRISIDSQFEELKVFRLYSSFTVEEKVLILAKQDLTLDSNLQNINRCTSHMLLTWGASYLFKRLDEFHGSHCTSSGCNFTSEESFSDDVVQELLNHLPNAEHSNMKKCSIILKVQQGGSTYSRDVSLPGEMETQSRNEELPHVFWTSLLVGRSPQWRYLSGPSPRVRRKVQYFDELPKKPQIEDGDVVKKRKKVVTNTSDPIYLKSGLNDEQKAISMDKEANGISEMPEVQMAESEERKSLRDLQKNLHLSLEPEILKLCDILKLPVDVKDMAGRFLEYIMNNNHVIREPVTILQAFQISVCWSAASLLKHKISRKDSLALAKQHLHFECKEEEAQFIYSKLRVLKKIFCDQVMKVVEPNFADYPASRTKEAEKNLFHVKVPQSKLSDEQELEEGEIRESPQSRNCLDQQVSTKQEQSSDSEKARISLKNNFSKSIKQVKKIHRKRMRKLYLKQMEEFMEFNKCREKIMEKAKVDLEKKQKLESALIRTIHSQVSVRLDKLRMVDQEFSRKKEELDSHMEVQQQMLEAMQLVARNEEERLMAHWLKEARSGSEVDSFAMIPLLDSGFRMEQLEGGEQSHVGIHEISAKRSGPSLGMQDPNSTVPFEAVLAEVPSVVPGEVVEADVCTELPTIATESGRENDEAVTTTTMASESENVIAVQQCSQIGTEDSQSLPSIGQTQINSPLAQKNDAPAQDSEVSSLQEQVVENLQPSESAGVRTEDIPSQDMQNSSQQVEVPPIQPPDVSSGQSNFSHLAPPSGLESRVLPSSSEIPFPGHSQTDILACDVIENSQSNGGGNSFRQLEVRTQLAEGQNEQLDDSCLQPDLASLHDDRLRVSSPQTLGPTQPPAVMHNASLNQSAVMQNVQLQRHLPMENDLGGSGTHSSDSSRSMGIVPESSNHPLLTAPVISRISDSLNRDPLHNELARICKEIDQAIKMHEEVKVRLNSECEKEIEEIRRKYNSMIQDAENAHAEKRNTLEANFNKVNMNRMLAQAFKLKCSDGRTFGTLRLQQGAAQGFVRPMYQFSSQQQTQRAVPPAASPSLPPLQVHHLSALFLSNPIRPHASPVIPPIRNHQVGGELRAPAPHLQPFRHSSSMSATSLPPLTSVMLPQQPFSSSAATSSMLPPPPTSVMLPHQPFSSSAATSSVLPPPPAPHPLVHPSGTFSQIPQPETMAGLPILHNSPQPAHELLTDISNHPCGNLPNLLPPLQGLTFDRRDMPELEITGASRSTAARAGSAGDVVCLSDDE